MPLNLTSQNSLSPLVRRLKLINLKLNKLKKKRLKRPKLLRKSLLRLKKQQLPADLRLLLLPLRNHLKSKLAKRRLLVIRSLLPRPKPLLAPLALQLKRPLRKPQQKKKPILKVCLLKKKRPSKKLVAIRTRSQWNRLTLRRSCWILLRVVLLPLLRSLPQRKLAKRELRSLLLSPKRRKLLLKHPLLLSMLSWSPKLSLRLEILPNSRLILIRKLMLIKQKLNLMLEERILIHK